MCCLNEVSSIASNYRAFVAITQDQNAIPWGHTNNGGKFNDYAKQQLVDDGLKVKFTIFCIFFLSFTIFIKNTLFSQTKVLSFDFDILYVYELIEQLVINKKIEANQYKNTRRIERKFHTRII